MALRLPIAVQVEYRGMKAASEFTDKETGRVVPMPPRAQFEVESDDGQLTIVPVSVAQLDKCSPPVDVGSLKRGQLCELRGAAVIQERGSDRDSFFAVDSLVPLAA